MSRVDTNTENRGPERRFGYHFHTALKHIFASRPDMTTKFPPAAWLRAMLLSVLLLSSIAQTRPAPAAAQADTLFIENFDGAFAGDANCKAGTCNVPADWGVWFIPRRDTDPQGVNFQPKYVQRSPRRPTVCTAAPGRSACSRRTRPSPAAFTARWTTSRWVRSCASPAWGQMWSTNDESPISARPSSGIKLKIGVDPLGGDGGKANPLNGQVTWSQEQEAKRRVCAVQRRGRGQVHHGDCLHLRHHEGHRASQPRCFGMTSVLEYVAAPAVVTPTVVASGEVAGTNPTTNTVPAEVQPEATAASIGGITHKIESGDTLFGLSIKYNVSVDEIKRLNNLTDDTILSLGQELIIVPPVIPPTPTPIPPTLVPTPRPGHPRCRVSVPITISNNITDTGFACVAAFFDDDGNGKYDTGEDFVPNVLFKLTAQGVTLATYTSDGVNEPHCFANLPAIDYTVSTGFNQGYVNTTPDQRRDLGQKRRPVDLLYRAAPGSRRRAGREQDPDAQPQHKPHRDQRVRHPGHGGRKFSGAGRDRLYRVPILAPAPTLARAVLPLGEAP